MAIVPDTTVTLEQMAEHLSAAVPAKVQRYYDDAVQTVAEVFANAFKDVPVESVDNCVLRVGRALRDGDKRASTGAAQVTATEAAPVRVPADPLASSYPIIRRYVVLGI